MAQVALVQHSPLDIRDGGAEETAYGVQCLDYLLRSPQGDLLKPDVIMFNWGCTVRWIVVCREVGGVGVGVGVDA